MALSRINIYIVYIIVTCHTIRLQFDVNNGDDGRNWFDDDDDDVYIDGDDNDGANEVISIRSGTINYGNGCLQ